MGVCGNFDGWRQNLDDGCEFLTEVDLQAEFQRLGLYGVVDHMTVWCRGSHELYGVMDHVNVWYCGSCECMVSWIT